MKRRNNRQAGFTLVECIAALVVLAVLAVFLVPALTRYLDEGREKQAVSEAQLCVTSATEWAAKQRAALLAKAYAANKDFMEAYADEKNAALRWSGSNVDLNAAAPTVTGGTIALTEGDGQYVLRPDTPALNGTANDAMKAAVTAAAEVDGRVTAMQLNADGKVLYLLYTAANGTTVAYTSADTAKDPATTVPVATLPENKTPTPPEPTEPEHSGNLVFRVLNEYTNQPVSGITFCVLDADSNKFFNSQITDDNGMVYFKLDPSGWDTNASDNCKYFTLHPENWPEGYQKVYPVRFRIYPNDSRTDFVFKYDTNSNQSEGQYMDGFTGKMEGSATDHLYTFYVRSVPTLELCVWDDDNGNYLNGVEFTLSNGTQSKTITSGLSPTLLDVQLHTEDKPRSGREVIDLSSDNSRGDWSVTCNSVPDGYRNFDNFSLKIDVTNLGEHNRQLYTDFSSNGNTKIERDNLQDQNKCVVTIHVQGGKEVNFFVYDGLDSNPTTQLPNATMKLCKKDGAEIATFTTDKNGNPTGAGNFTKNLSEGEYTLHLERGKPDGYDNPADIPFKVERNADGLLTLTGTGANATCVDNDKSTVTMLVTKPNTKRIQLQVVDANTKQPWAGVNVKVTGKCLNATKEEKRYYAIGSLAENTHSLDLDMTESGDITVTIAGSDNKNEFEKDFHNDSYTNNFVGSKFVFNLQKNADGTVTLTKTNGKEQFNGEISQDCSTVYVYAYPQVIVDFNTKRFVTGVEIAVRKSILHIVTSEDAIPTTVNGKELSPWEVIQKNHDHSVGLSLGSYKLYANRETLGYYKTMNLPLSFKVTQQTNGFPAVTNLDGSQILDYDTKQPYKDEKGNILPKITAWYQSSSYVEP